MLASLAEAAAATGTAGVAARPPRPTPSSCSRTSGAPTGAGCGPGRRRWGGGRARHLASRRRPRRPGRRVHPTGRGDRPGPLDRRGPSHRRRPCSICSGTTRPAACSPPAPTARTSSTRQKDLMDNAYAVGQQPRPPWRCSGSAALTGDDRYRDRAEDILRLLGPLARHEPGAFGHLLAPPTDGSAGADRDRRRRRPPRPRRRGAPALPAQTRCSPGASPPDSPLWEDRPPGQAYVCEDFACQQPVDTPTALAAQLEAS